MRLLAFLLLLMLPVSANARDEVHLPRWTIIPETSSLIFEATQMGAVFQGEFRNFVGTIYFDPALGPAGFSADIEIDMPSVDTQSADRDKYIHDAVWLDTAVHPKATFKADKFEKTEDGHYIAHGSLTLRDVTLPVDLPFTLDIAEDGQSAHAVGEAPISRLDFGVGQGDWADTGTVGEMVKVKIDIKAQRNSAP